MDFVAYFNENLYSLNVPEERLADILEDKMRLPNSVFQASCQLSIRLISYEYIDR